MRIPDTAFGMSDALNAARARLLDAQGRAASGRRVVHASDDPVAVHRDVTLRAAEASSVRYAENAAVANDALQAAEGALQTATDLVGHALEITMTMANGTQNADTRAIGAVQVQELRATLLQIANARVAGRYVFSGVTEDVPPFDASGVHQGSSTARQIGLSPATTMEIEPTGDEVFAAAGGVDVFQTLTDLETALLANDQNGARAALDPLHAAIDQISAARAGIGSRMERVEALRTAAAVEQESFARARSRAVDTDAFEAYTALIQAEQEMQSVAQVAARVGSISVLSLMR